MEIEDRISALEAELQQTKDELQKILVDIRAYLSQIPDPAPNEVEVVKPENESE